MVIPYEYSTLEIGKPQMPCVRNLIQINPTAGLTIQNIINDDTIFQSNTVLPSQHFYVNPESLPGFVIDTTFYNSYNDWYPSCLVDSGSPAIFIDLRVSNIGLYLIQYNPYQSLVKVITDYTCIINFSGYDPRNVTDGIPEVENHRLDKIYDEFVVNYERQLDTLVPTGGLRLEPEEYHIIVADAYYNLIQTFATWRAKCGFNIKITKCTQIPGYTGTESDTVVIKNYLRSTVDIHYWNNVLLIGDENQIPFFTEWRKPEPPPDNLKYYSDHYYSLLYGSDNIPDITIARFYCKNTNDVQTMIDKTMRYDFYPVYHSKACSLYLWYCNGSSVAKDTKKTYMIIFLHLTVILAPYGKLHGLDRYILALTADWA